MIQVSGQAKKGRSPKNADIRMEANGVDIYIEVKSPRIVDSKTSKADFRDDLVRLSLGEFQRKFAE